VSECPICEKHRGEGVLAGELLYEDENVFVSHAPPAMVDGYLGYLFVDAKRHVRGLAELEDAEACAMALIVTRLAKALRRKAPSTFTPSPSTTCRITTSTWSPGIRARRTNSGARAWTSGRTLRVAARPRSRLSATDFARRFSVRR
jgi:hypothetical protein